MGRNTTEQSYILVAVTEEPANTAGRGRSSLLRVYVEREGNHGMKL